MNIGGPALKDSLPEQPSSSGRMADDSASEEPADELLTVKQPDGQGSGHQADAALLAAAAVAPTARKRKKLKIKLDAPASNRVVFDEAGTSQAPLAALADGTNPEYASRPCDCSVYGQMAYKCRRHCDAAPFCLSPPQQGTSHSCSFRRAPLTGRVQKANDLEGHPSRGCC